MEHDLSCFDVACLAAAICAQRDQPSHRGSGTSRAAVDTAAVHDAIRYFMYAGNVMNALDAGVSSALPGKGASSVTTALNMACMGGLLVCTLIEKGDRWFDVAAGAAGVIAVALYAIYNKLFVIVGQALFMIVRVATTIADIVSQDGRAVAYNLAGILEAFLALIVNIGTTDWKRNEAGVFEITRKPLDPIRAATHAAIQYFLGALAYNIYTGQPLISASP